MNLPWSLSHERQYFIIWAKNSYDSSNMLLCTLNFGWTMTLIWRNFLVSWQMCASKQCLLWASIKINASFLLAQMLKHQSSLFSNTLLQDTSWCLWMRLGKFKTISWICEILNDVQIQDVVGISVFFCENFHIVKNVFKK